MWNVKRRKKKEEMPLNMVRNHVGAKKKNKK